MSVSVGPTHQALLDVIYRWQSGTTNESLGFIQFTAQNQNYQDLVKALENPTTSAQEKAQLNVIKAAWDKLIKLNQLHEAFVTEFENSHFSKASFDKFQEFAKLLEDYNLNDSKVVTDINVNDISSIVGKFKQGISLQTSVMAGAMSPIGSYFKEISECLQKAPTSDDIAVFKQDVEARKNIIEVARLRSEAQKQEREFEKVQVNFQRVSNELGTKGLEIAKLAISGKKLDKKSLNSWKMTYVLLEGQKELAAAQLAFREAYKSDRSKGQFYSENTVEKYNHLFDLLVKFQNNYILYNKVARFPPELAQIAGDDGLSRWFDLSQKLMTQFPQLTKEIALATPGAWNGDKNGKPNDEHPLGKFFILSDNKVKKYNDTFDASADPETAKTILLKTYKQSVAPIQSGQKKNEEIKTEKGDVAVAMSYLGDVNEGRHNTKEFIRDATGFKLPDSNWEVHENPQDVGNRLSKKSVFIIKEKGDTGKALFKITVDKNGVKIEGVGISNSNDPKYLQQMNEIIKQLHTNPPPKETPELQSNNIKSMIVMMSHDVYTLDGDSARVIRKDRERIKAESKIYEHYVKIKKGEDNIKLIKQFQQAIDNGLIPMLLDDKAQPGFQNQGALGLPLRINTDDAVIAIKQYEPALAAGMVIVLGDKATDAIKKGASENPITVLVPQNENTGRETLARIVKATEAGLLVNNVAPPVVMNALKEHLKTSPFSSILLRGQPDPYLAVKNLIGLGIACTLNGDEVRKKVQERQGIPMVSFEIPETGSDERNLELLKHYLSQGISVKVPDAEKLFESLEQRQVIIPLENLPKDEQLKQVQALAAMGIDANVSKGIVPSNMPITIRSNYNLSAIKSFERLLSQGFMPIFEKKTQENLAKNNGDLGVYISDLDSKKLLEKMQHCFTVGVKVCIPPEQLRKLREYIAKHPNALPNKIVIINGFDAAAIRENLKLCQALGINVNATERAKFILKSDPNRDVNPIEVQDVNKRINKKGSLSLDVEKTMEKAKNLAATGCKVILSPGAQSYLQQLDRNKLKEEAAKRIFFFFTPRSAKEAQEKLKDVNHYASFIEVTEREQLIPTKVVAGTGSNTTTPDNHDTRPKVTTFSARPTQPLPSMDKQPFEKVKEEIVAVFKNLFDKTLDGYIQLDGDKMAINKQVKEVLDEVRKKESPEEIKKYLDSVCNGTMNYNAEIKKLASDQLQKLEPKQSSRPQI